MTTFFQFKPSNVAPFSFQPTLNGSVYNATVPWLLFGRRYYLNLASLNGTVLWFGAIVGSPSGIAIQSLSWADGIVTATLVTPHGYRIASTIALTIVGCTPDAYNGQVEAMATGPNTLVWPLAADPGIATVFGAANYNINLIGGVPNENGDFFTSTLVFRQNSQQFEVSP